LTSPLTRFGADETLTVLLRSIEQIQSRRELYWGCGDPTPNFRPLLELVSSKRKPRHRPLQSKLASAIRAEERGGSR